MQGLEARSQESRWASAAPQMPLAWNGVGVLTDVRPLALNCSVGLVKEMPRILSQELDLAMNGTSAGTRHDAALLGNSPVAFACVTG